ncbi:MAG: endonuclease NucS domain-containing protein [Thermoplasmatota archaeon]
MKRFLVVVPNDAEALELHPMKAWLKHHPDHVPSGLDAAASNSHSLRNGLRKAGWGYETTDTEERLLFPGTRIETPLADVEEATVDEITEAAFALEHQLRDFIAENLHAIDVGGRRLRLYVDEREVEGTEYDTDVGRIDILAVDDAGAFYVFELKRARAPDAAIGQLARYMGWISKTIGRGKPVHGIIIAREIGDGLRYAANVVPNVSLFGYEVSFSLKPVPSA